MKSARHKKSQKIVNKCYKRRGWLSTIEHYLKGKKIDVLAQNIKTKYIIANEIELTPRHCLENIKMDLKVGCNEVVIICENSAVLEAVKKKARTNLDNDIFNMVSFKLINEFIPTLHGGIKQNSRYMREFNTEINLESNLE